MKKILLFLSLLVIVSLACDLSVTVSPPTSPAPLPTNTATPAPVDPAQEPAAATVIPAASLPVATPTSQQPAPGGSEVFFGPIRLALPLGLASGISGSQFPRAEGPDIAPWDMTPGHTQVKLEGYLLQGKFHRPYIYVYPAQGYAEQNPSAFESLHRLNNILYDPAAPVSADQLPLVPFFNAGQLFASNVQVLSFQSGQGVRFLTEYGQHAASVNNQDLFYHFQGLTSDGVYYIIAILPVTAPALAETSDGGTALPSGGVPYPDLSDPNADLPGYYAAITSLLNGTSPQSFAPTLSQLDALIQSIRITQ